ncbi:Coenzyme F420 hydrogenase/dehydrogenase, beta subunit C-terminal domain [Thomasclavelia spiroformis]|uniref:Coenzyme F420 hydrogenase/dehydrogenase, beta subunit C-terminal domain n=1 Tax=Thomasclavelia spiroformis TaxID=29348 RepID=UPI00241DA1D8|nr:Coenzyme F420 hydrogenase/dehydrogenase, beta subunit C-terminal domain [Thomasclavelia spiroformis]MBS6115844.1 Coenzyme F420 hydrogenase/dehydrogenase, beta subunit C-terminal domain [Thomasclavelia spiroformis]
MIDKVTIKECYLCKACSNICPANAIDYLIEEKGFLYPEINYSKCTNCNMCEKVCPVINNTKTKKVRYPITYALRSKNIDVRLNSSSGGIFFELGSYVLDQGGSACGAIFVKDFQVMHVITNEKNMLKKMCGSKYVQSDVGLVYRKIKEKLNAGKTVLFCGCPCQTSALKFYLKKDYNNLFLIDFICHGIPSQTFLDAYIKTMEEKYHSKASQIEFRNKDKGWHRSCVKILFENGKIYNELVSVDVYMTAFLNGTIMKESCYHCGMKNFNSNSDITLGDFWGAELYFPEIDDNTGISVAFVNTEKGNDLLNLLDIEKFEVDKEKIIKYNRNVIESTKPHQKRNEFYKYCEKNDIGKALFDFFGESKSDKLERLLKYRLRCIKNKICGKDKPLY